MIALWYCRSLIRYAHTINGSFGSSRLGTVVHMDQIRNDRIGGRTIITALGHRKDVMGIKD